MRTLLNRSSMLIPSERSYNDVDHGAPLRVKAKKAGNFFVKFAGRVNQPCLQMLPYRYSEGTNSLP